jgi:hypothetical protein
MKLTGITTIISQASPIQLILVLGSPGPIRQVDALFTGARRSGREAQDLTPASIEAKNALIVQFGATDMHSGDTRFDLHCLKRDFTLLYTRQITLPNSFIKYDEYGPLTGID